MKRFIASLLAVAMLAAVAGCSQSGAPADSGDAAETPSSQGAEAPSPEPQGGKELRLWIFLNPESTEDARSVVLKNLVDDYNATNPLGNTVVVESMNWDKIESASIQAAAAGTGPDILNFFSDYTRTHISGGTIQPMTQYAREFLTQMPDYLHSEETLTVDGEIYGLPWESRVYVYWYRNDIYDKVPATLDELVAITASKTDDQALGFALGMSEGSHASTFMESFIPWIKAAGGQLLDESGKAVFNTDAGVRVLNTMKALYTEGAMNKSAISMTLDDVQDAFKAGAAYAISVGSHRSASLSSSSLKDHFSSAPIPGYEEGAPAPALVAGQTLAIGKYSQDPAGSFDFIKSFFTDEVQVEFMKANTMTVRNSLYEQPDIQALPNFEALKAWTEYAQTGAITMYPNDYSELSVALVKAAQNVVFNEADPKAELDKVAEWYNNK